MYAALSQDSDTSVQLKVAMVIELMDYIINHTSVSAPVIKFNPIIVSPINRVLCSILLEYHWIYFEVCTCSYGYRTIPTPTFFIFQYLSNLFPRLFFPLKNVSGTGSTSKLRSLVAVSSGTVMSQSFYRSTRFLS